MSRSQLLSVALAAACSLGAVQIQAGDLFLDFKYRVTRYVQLRSDVERRAGVQAPSGANPRYAAEAQQRVVEGIRKARDGADRGDFFRGPTEAALRQTLDPLIAAAEGASIKAALSTTSSEPIELTINGDYPASVTLTPVPMGILRALPSLPDGLEYRFIPRHLVLYDARANLVLDYMTMSAGTAL